MYKTLILSIIGLVLGYFFKQDPTNYYYFIAQVIVVGSALFMFNKETKELFNVNNKKK